MEPSDIRRLANELRRRDRSLRRIERRRELKVGGWKYPDIASALNESNTRLKRIEERRGLQ